MTSLEKDIKDFVLQTIYIDPSTFNRVRPGELTKDGGRVFVSQFSHFTRNFPRWLAAVASNCPIPDARKFLVANMYEEEVGPGGQGSHYDLLLRQGEALGLSRQDVESTAPLPSTAVAVDAIDSICRGRSWLEGLAATTGLECINHPALRAEAGVIIINDVRSWRHLGLNAQQLRSRTVHTEEDEKHVESGLKILAEQAATEESAAKAVAAAREALLAFRLLMEGIGRAALSEVPKKT